MTQDVDALGHAKYGVLIGGMCYADEHRSFFQSTLLCSVCFVQHLIFGFEQQTANLSDMCDTGFVPSIDQIVRKVGCGSGWQ
jgi:hypothetical protein